MKELTCQVFSSWPYDRALAWMSEGHARVRVREGLVIVGCGSHRETVITSGRSQLAVPKINYQQNLLLRQLDRGGGLTAHEPGQLVLYPIFHVEHHGLTVPLVVLLLEISMIDFLREIGVSAHRSDQGPGVFVGDEKIGFIGLRIKERVVTHGLALNVLNDASIFSQFDPCGIKALGVTSARYHVSLNNTIDFYAERLLYHFMRLFSRARTKMGINFDVGVLLSNATDDKGTSTFASGK